MYARKNDILQFCLTDCDSNEIPFIFCLLKNDAIYLDEPIRTIPLSYRDFERYNVVQSSDNNLEKCYLEYPENYTNRPFSTLVEVNND